LTDNIFFGAFLKALKPVHCSDVIIGPEKGPLLKLLEERSKQF